MEGGSYFGYTNRLQRTRAFYIRKFVPQANIVITLRDPIVRYEQPTAIFIIDKD